MLHSNWSAHGACFSSPVTSDLGSLLLRGKARGLGLSAGACAELCWCAGESGSAESAAWVPSESNSGGLSNLGSISHMGSISSLGISGVVPSFSGPPPSQAPGPQASRSSMSMPGKVRCAAQPIVIVDSHADHVWYNAMGVHGLLRQHVSCPRGRRHVSVAEHFGSVQHMLHRTAGEEGDPKLYEWPSSLSESALGTGDARKSAGCG